MATPTTGTKPTPTKPATTPRKASLTERRAFYRSQYRQAESDYGTSLETRDAALVNMFRSLPDTVTTKKKTATGETITNKPVSDRQRAKDTLLALAVGVDDKGVTRDRFALTDVRVVAIVKAYMRAETAVGASPVNGALAPVMETPQAAALVTALTTAARSTNLGDKGADALAETMRGQIFESTDAVKPVDVVKAAEALTRDAIAKATEARKVAAEAAKAKATTTPDVERPVVAISNAVDSLEAALVAQAKDLDAQQKTLIHKRLEALLLHLS